MRDQGTGPSSNPDCSFISPRPGTSVNSLPYQARHAPFLRANPYSEVTDPFCRLPLPLLSYRLEALNLGDLLRIWVRTGATPPRVPLLDFQGPRGRSGHRRNCGALRIPNPFSLLKVSRELECLYRKENSFRTSCRCLQVILGCPDEHSCECPNYVRFRCRGLGSTDSCPTAVHTKPFSTSVLQGLAGVFATTTKICTDGGSRQAHAQTLLRTPPRPSYLSKLHNIINMFHMLLTVEYRHNASAPSIFRASCFGSYPEGNFGGNQLLDGSISLSPLYPVQTIDLHVRIATDLHQGFP
ncbi:hypothetical protein KQX54_000730 [Cotesia glomerata]|uniref:Uncharacterized protein n=1 Tax=Cotesia glomerata TaxID=32391 RepID=A0AAV7IBW6_COTGL|nr:hypothetical protein KQX54_000730 [Cotesia glomerata]